MNDSNDSQIGTYVVLVVLAVLVTAVVWFTTRPPELEAAAGSTSTSPTSLVVADVEGGRLVAGASAAILESAAAGTLRELAALAALDGVGLREVDPTGSLPAAGGGEVTIKAAVVGVYENDGQIEFTSSVGDALCLTVGDTEQESFTTPGRC